MPAAQYVPSMLAGHFDKVSRIGMPKCSCERRAERTSLQPFGICPMNALDSLELTINAMAYVHEVVDVLEEVPLYIAWQDDRGALPQHVNLAHQKTMILVRQHVVLIGNGSSQCSVNRSAKSQPCSRSKRNSYLSTLTVSPCFFVCVIPLRLPKMPLNHWTTK